MTAAEFADWNRARMKRTAEMIAVKEAREHLQFQQVEFAALLGVHPITVSKWENGRAKPSAWHLAIICAFRSSPRNRDIMACFCSRGIPAALALALEHLHR